MERCKIDKSKYIKKLIELYPFLSEDWAQNIINDMTDFWVFVIENS